MILPGIGAIVAEYIAASIDFESGRILPPQRRISLNTAIRHDDGMLATSIARAEQIKFEEAREILHRATADILSILSAEKEYSLGSLGRLILGEEERINFYPSLTPEEACRAIGMAPVPSRLPSATSQEERTATPPAVAAQLPPHKYMRILSDKNYYIPVNKIFARSAAAVIVIIAFVLPFIMPRSSQSPTQVNASLNPVETLTSSHTSTIDVPNNASQTHLGEDIDSDAAEASTAVATDSPSTETYADDEPIEYLIVATFRSQKQADEYIAQQAGTEYALRAIEHKGVYRISAACGDNATLRVILNSSEFKKAYPQAWIWSI